MNGIGRCVPCEAAAMGGLQGIVGGGLGAIVMEPVRGLGQNGPGGAIGESLANALGSAAVWVAPGAMMAGAAANTALLSALAAPRGAKAKTAATTALLAAGVTGVGSAATLGIVGGAAEAPGGWGPAVLWGALGLAALGWGGYRAYKTFRR